MTKLSQGGPPLGGQHQCRKEQVPSDRPRRQSGHCIEQKLLPEQLERRVANMEPCLIGMEASVGAHHLSRQLQAFGGDARLMPARYVKPFLKGQKNDFRDAEAIAKAVQRLTTRFVSTKSMDQLDVQALHRVGSCLVRQCTGVINQIRALLRERGIVVSRGYRFLKAALPDLLSRETEVLSLRMVRMISDLAGDWRQLDDRLEAVTCEIEELAAADEACQGIMSVPGVGPIVASAIVSAIGDGAAFASARGLRCLAGLGSTADFDRGSINPRGASLSWATAT